jgi:4-hydroxybenzoate polyprenyltransferase
MNIITSLKKYLSLVKFSHTVFAMPFAFIGFFLGANMHGQNINLLLLLKVVICMIFARNAAMGFNRFADNRYDLLNPRTAEREIPKGIISPAAALIFVIINSLAFIITTGFINNLTLVLSPVALLVILGYSLTKRITSLCHFILGLGLSLAPIGAYISVTGEFHLLPVIFSLIVLTWVSGFDIIYALQDDEFDIANNLFSIPSKTGRTKALAISVLIHFTTFLLVISAGVIGKSGFLFWSGAAVFSSLLIYQHLLVKPKDLSRVNLAFATTNGLASIVFSIFVIFDMYIRLK